MPPLKDVFYTVFMKRTTVYVPFIFVGSYFSNEFIDYGIDKFWTSRNRGKLFADMIQTLGPAQE